MKYGETLRRRSIPAWAHYNVDYDEIKRVIKEHTTPGNGQAVSIPGQGFSVERGFEDDLIELFEQEQRRVDLFVKTKAGEIDRRLIHLGKQIYHLAEREKTVAGARVPARRLERYARLEDDVLKIGQELNGLSRYLNAQRTAFRKLLKKYRKWTGNDTLQVTVKESVMNQPGSCWNVNLSPMFDRYTELLQIIRSAFEPVATSNGGAPRRFISGKESVPRNTLEAVATIQEAAESNNELDLDVALATTKFGHRGGKAIYWVNPESAIELQVLLLRHMRLLVPQEKVKISPFSTEPSSPIGTPSRRPSAPGIEGDDKEDQIGTLVLDSKSRYAEQEIGKTIEDNEGVPGKLPVKAIGQIFWSSAGEAAVLVGLNSGSEAGITTTKTKRKHLSDLLDVSRPFSRRSSSAILRNHHFDSTDSDPANSVRDWLSHHNDVSPIAGHCARRTRFLGLTNNSSRAIWATLDKDIYLKRTETSDICAAEWAMKMQQGGTRFPHYVLEVRHEGFESAELVNILDNSHLTERIRGFSLETHAVWECVRPASMPPPFWLSIVSNPISNVPEEERRRPRRLASLNGSSDPLVLDKASISATSNTDGDLTNVSSPQTNGGGNTSNTSAPDQLETPALSAFKKKRRRNLSLRTDTVIEHPENGQEQPKYWNEYDHPEEGSNEDAFVIYVDPNASNFPGEQHLRTAYDKIKIFFGGSQKNDEESPLLVSPTGSNNFDSESSDDESSPTRRTPRHPNDYQYGTLSGSTLRAETTAGPKSIYTGLVKAFTSNDNNRNEVFGGHTYPFLTADARHREREQQKYRLYLTSLGAAATIVAILAIMVTTSRHKFREEVDTALIVGIVANLALAFTGVGYMMSRQDVLPWWHRTIVGVVFVSVCIVDGILLIWPFTAAP